MHWNALDFHIAFQLGRTFETAPETECIVLSQDKGYDPLLVHLNKKGLACRRILRLEALGEPDSVKLLVRAKHNRKLQDEQERLFETIRAKPVVGYQGVQLPRQHNRAKREAKLAIRFASVTLCPPKTKSRLANVEVPMVLAQKVDAPEGGTWWTRPRAERCSSARSGDLDPSE